MVARQLLLFAALFSTLGCTSDDDCAERGICTSGVSGAGGGIAAGCVPSELGAGESVRAECGVFVSSSMGSDLMGDGSKERPYATISKAIAADALIYLCAESYEEAVTLPS